jgi:transglutaminase-like putative cysteine protease
MADSRVGLGAWALRLSLGWLGTASLGLALAGPDRAAWITALVSAALVGVAAGLGWWSDRRGTWGSSGSGLGGWRSALLVGLFALPGLVQLWRVATTGRGEMFEVVAIESLRNLGLGLLALSSRLFFERLLVLVSLTSVLVGTSMVEGGLVRVMAGIFILLGMIWLARGYWEAQVSARAGVGRVRFPFGIVGTLLVVGGLLLAVAGLGAEGSAALLAELVPSSGGTDWEDEGADSGVNDGSNEVEARDNPQGTGFSQSEVYMDSEKSSLYDAFNDMYGEPIRRKSSERAMAVSSADVREQGPKEVENLQNGREFSAVRRKPRRSQPRDRPADALVFVKGRAPAHLRLTAYDRYEGQTWQEAPAGPSLARLRPEGGKSPWIRLEGPEGSVHAGTTRHRYKIGRLETQAIPSTGPMERFRVGSVNRVDFYEWGQEQILRMRDRSIPSGTVVESDSRTVNRRKLSGVRFPGQPAYALARYLAPGTTARVSELAREWVTGIPRGWGQVEQVVDRLRHDCVHDREAGVPEDCPDAVEHFVCRSKRGPDYLFASAAALMLRSLDYPTRVVSGLYVRPEAYDAKTEQTPVQADDVHFWAEVMLPDGSWVPIEPTPGYELMAPVLSWGDRWVEALAMAWRFVANRWRELCLALVLLWLAYATRRDWLDWIWTLAWRIEASMRPTGQTAVAAVRLLDQRLRWAGLERPVGRTPRRWVEPIALRSGGSFDEDLGRLLGLAEGCLFGRTELQGRVDAGVGEACQRAVRAWTWRRLRQGGKPQSGDQDRRGSNA